MKAVYPVTRHNAALYGQLATLFAKVGPQREHGIVLISCPSALGSAQTFAESVRRMFGSCEIYVTAVEIDKTPRDRNIMFKEAVSLLAKNQNSSPWVWMENAYPLDREWLAMLDEEWDRKSPDRHFVGCIERAYREQDGKFIDMGPYMRFGIYPANFAQVVPEYRYTENVPFEVDLRSAIAYRCQESKIMATIWASVDYERADGGFEGKQTPEYEPAIRAAAKTSVKSKGLAVLHGCRDGSLGMLLVKADWSKSDYVPRKKGVDSTELQRAKETIAALTLRVTALQEEVDALRKHNADVLDAVRPATVDSATVAQHFVSPASQELVRVADDTKGAIQYADCAVMSPVTETPRVVAEPVVAASQAAAVPVETPATTAPRRRGRPPKKQVAA